MMPCFVTVSTNGNERYYGTSSSVGGSGVVITGTFGGGMPQKKPRAIWLNDESLQANVGVAVATSESDTYNPEMVRKVLRAKAAPGVGAPSGSDEFLDWLNQP